MVFEFITHILETTRRKRLSPLGFRVASSQRLAAGPIGHASNTPLQFLDHTGLLFGQRNQRGRCGQRDSDPTEDRGRRAGRKEVRRAAPIRAGVCK